MYSFGKRRSRVSKRISKRRNRRASRRSRRVSRRSARRNRRASRRSARHTSRRRRNLKKIVELELELVSKKRRKRSSKKRSFGIIKQVSGKLSNQLRKANKFIKKHPKKTAAAAVLGAAVLGGAMYARKHPEKINDLKNYLSKKAPIRM